MNRRPSEGPGGGRTLITGGAGFVGANLAERLLSQGGEVTVLDALSRPGTELNLRWLQERHGDRLHFIQADIRDRERLRQALNGVDAVFHFAAQVAVTSSLEDPLADHGINGWGTLLLLEELRALDQPPFLLFTSTNKVYGNLESLSLVARDGAYRPADDTLHRHGIAETQPLAFCSPYGCSKGAADQYVLDYARTFGLPATVFRMSCIYGPRQFGNEDQGWVAHFLLRALSGAAITIFGDGFQVRDVLFIDDLIAAMLCARARPEQVAGEVFNIGGGPDNVLGIGQLVARLEALTGRKPAVQYAPWRASDQRYYVSDIRRFATLTGWRPQTPVAHGLAQLQRWLLDGGKALPNAGFSSLPREVAQCDSP